jgi:hypothetical protein
LFKSGYLGGFAEKLYKPRYNDLVFKENLSATHFILLDNQALASISNHPPHIIDQNGVINPSAFIPFCYFGEQALGEKIPNFSEPVCTLTVPINIDGQLCYSIDVNDALIKNTILHGENNALHFYLDYFEEKSTWIDAKENKNQGFKEAIDKAKDAKIIIETIAPFVAFGGGHFLLSNVQESKTTKDFDNLSLMSRGCSLNKDSTIKNEKTESTASQKCKCIPFDVSEVPAKQVNFILL